MAADCKSAAPWSYGGSNPPLCTSFLEGKHMQPAGARRKSIALALLAVFAGLAWVTIDPGRVRWLVLVLLGGFALRILLSAGPSRYDRVNGTEQLPEESSKEGLM